MSEEMTVLGTIASGGFGYVEKVQMPDGSVVARKVFSPNPSILDQVSKNSLLNRFRREVMIQQNLSGDYFIPVIQSKLDSDVPWFTMPLAEDNYANKLASDRQNGVIDLLPLADILNSLEELHRLDYKHRDLKPQNILLHDKRWKLADFGLAIPPHGDVTQITRTSEAYGTRDYMAPEQATNFHYTPCSADVYSFGCMLCDLYNNNRPRVPYQQHRFPGAVGEVVAKCTALDPEMRYGSIAELREELFAAVATVGTTMSEAAIEWHSELSSIETWDKGKLDRFVEYISLGESGGILREITANMLSSLSKLNPTAWLTIGDRYCDWVEGEDFPFQFCDVLVGRLEEIFVLGPVSLSSRALIAAVKLAVSHNRWYVMLKSMQMSNHKIDRNIAERIAMEIKVLSLHYYFKQNVLIISRNIEDYHPLICEVLQKQ